MWTFRMVEETLQSPVVIWRGLDFSRVARKVPEAMHLRRCLAFLEAKWGIQLWAEHVKGEDK